MTSLKQIEANRRNALKSTGPRTVDGKARSRENALRHGLTAETVITSLENAADYQVFEATIYAEYQPRTASSRELVARLASVLWRLRRCTSIETGLMQIQGELMRSRALLLQVFYGIRSERQLMEQLDYNLLYRWFVGLSPDDPVWDPTVFTKNRKRLQNGEVFSKFMSKLLNHPQVKPLLSDEHFSVDGTLIEACLSEELPAQGL